MSELEIPALSLVALVGVSGSGKSTFARQNFAPTQVLSSDYFRGLVADDENDQSATGDAFEALHYIAGKRLDAGRLTVIDATNVQEHARKQLVNLARAHDVVPVAIVLDVPVAECARRNESRPDRDFGDHVIRRQHGQLRRSIRTLQREGFRIVHVLRSTDDIGAARVSISPMLNDKRHLAGPFDVIGDVHGCRIELEELLGTLGYTLRRDDAGLVVGAVPPPGRTAVFVGDLVDRGPDTPGVLRLVMGMVAAGEALCVPGNHENKLVRALRGKNVKLSHGLAESLAQLKSETDEFRSGVERFVDDLVSHLVLDDGRLVVAHAGLKEAYHGRASGRVRSFALYGETTGETDEYGLPVRYPWAQDYRGRAMVLYGHTPTPRPEWVNNTLCLDTGCVFGGRLTALRYPERELISVPAHQVWYEPIGPFSTRPGADESVPAPGAGEGCAGEGRAGEGCASRREPDVLDLGDVFDPDATGGRVIETVHHGRVGVRVENAVGALEVMSRFALDPRWLLYLPPTMAPCATSLLPDLLEHPAEAFEAYRDDGIGEVICEEKHMGSRAVVALCRDADVARERFGATGGATGAVWTRTGRPFLNPALTEVLLARLRAAVSAAGLWSELGASWLLFDAELMPWSAKALELLRTQYAAVGAAARAALPDAVTVLEQAAARLQTRGSGESDVAGVDELAGRMRQRLTDAEAFTAAYRRYCWPTDGLDGIRLAPFQLLASDAVGLGSGDPGQTYHHRDHVWHLDLADALAAADPVLVQPTKRLVVHTGDERSVSASITWWEELTAAGGEGMVVKPLAGVTRGTRGLVQPGIKVRGREYLRIIYGPDYTLPQHLDRLRQRRLGHKRSLALREYALGLEALERAARGEPLWRVHECVFAVLACESEPVDPRL